MEVAREPARDCLPMGLREDCFPHTCNPLGSQAHADSLIMSQLVFCVSLTDSEEQKKITCSLRYDVLCKNDEFNQE